MIFDADAFVPATEKLQLAVRNQGDSYGPVFAAACKLLSITNVTLFPEVIYDGHVHTSKREQAINEIFGSIQLGNNALFKVVDDDGELVGWQVMICYNEDDYSDDYDDSDDYADEDYQGDAYDHED